MTKSATREAADKVTFTQTEVNSAVATKLPLVGGTMTGALVINSPNQATGGSALNIRQGNATTFGIDMGLSQTDGHLNISRVNSGTSTHMMTLARDTGNVGIGTANPDSTLHLKSSATNLPVLKLENTYESGGGTPSVAGNAPIIELYANDSGTGQPDSQELGIIEFRGSNKDTGAEELYTRIVGTNGDANSTGELKFETQQSNTMTTALTIRGGSVGINATPSTSGKLIVAASTTKNGLEISNHSYYSPNAIRVNNSDTINRAGHEIVFNRGGSDVGSISTSTSSTSYNTSSDYRLKENVVPMSGATAQTKLLKPCNFDWIAGGNVNGFIAHELAEVVPEAVSGTKDAMRDEEYEVTPATDTEAAVMGTRSVPDLQGIDQSKLVPLLTATIQELIARIEALEGE